MAIWYRSKSVSLPTSLGPSGRLRALLDQSQLVTSPLLETRSGVPIGAAAYRAIEDEIHISLFDENNVSAVDLDDEGTTKHKKQQRWLAGLSIPFHTLHQNGKVDGILRMDVPAVLPGYSRTPNSHTLASIYLTLEPAQPLPSAGSVSDSIADALEDRELAAHITRWQRSLPKGRETKVKVLCKDLQDNQLLTLQFVCAQAPPELGATDVVKAAARFVSMIPFMTDWSTFTGKGEVWCTSDEFLDIRCGDWEEHAIMLCNFFLHLGLEAYVVSGRGLPEGDTMYVMTRDNSSDRQTTTFWNASNGQSFDSTDPNCSLTEVIAVMNGSNIWANIQVETAPALLSYNLQDLRSWKALFGISYPKPPSVSSLQPVSLLYEPVNMKPEIEDLEWDIEEELKEEFRKWRSESGKITRFNRSCERSLKTVLKRLELEALGGVPLDNNARETPPELSDFMSYKMVGFTLNKPFTEIQPLCEAIYNTNIHKCGAIEDNSTTAHNRTEFAIAVYVHGYVRSAVRAQHRCVSLVCQSDVPASFGFEPIGAQP